MEADREVTVVVDREVTDRAPVVAVSKSITSSITRGAQLIVEQGMGVLATMQVDTVEGDTLRVVRVRSLPEAPGSRYIKPTS